MTRRTVFTETVTHLARSWLRIWLGPSPGCFFHSPRISFSRCSSLSTPAGPLVGDGPSFAATSRICARWLGVYRFAGRGFQSTGFATLLLDGGLASAGRLAQLPS